MNEESNFNLYGACYGPGKLTFVPHGDEKGFSCVASLNNFTANVEYYETSFRNKYMKVPVNNTVTAEFELHPNHDGTSLLEIDVAHGSLSRYSVMELLKEVENRLKEES